MKLHLAKLFDRTFWKFILVGVVNTLVGTGAMFILYNVFHCSYWFSSAGNYLIGSIVSYLLNKYFTFQDRQRDHKTMFRFIVNISLCYLIAYGCAQPIVKVIFINANTVLRDNLAMVCGMGLFVMLNYAGQRFFVFRRKNEQDERINHAPERQE